jgi:hypothetical protein
MSVFDPWIKPADELWTEITNAYPKDPLVHRVLQWDRAALHLDREHLAILLVSILVEETGTLRKRIVDGVCSTPTVIMLPVAWEARAALLKSALKASTDLMQTCQPGDETVLSQVHLNLSLLERP